MSMKIVSLFCVVILAFIAFACSSEVSSPIPDAQKKGSMKIELEHKLGTQDFQLLQKMNLNDSITITAEEFKYYVSNISLNKSDGTSYIVPQDSSYFLIDQSKIASRSITLNSIPEGDFSSITFILGVDSARSVSSVDKRTGVLDVANQAKSMYWTWNSGYIFFMFEGSFTNKMSFNNAFTYHIGGFGGYNTTSLNNIKTITIPFGTSSIKIREGKNPHLHLIADIEKVFKNESPISIITNPTVMFSPYSVNVANNYATMFRFDKIMD